MAVVFSGHSEMFERSFVDGDGVGVHYYDVGVAGDGLRGEQVNGPSLNDPLLKYNPFSQWTADQDEPERWAVVDGVVQLMEGGKHYGHLEVNVQRLMPARDLPAGAQRLRYRSYASVTLTPVYVFPLFDKDWRLVDTQRRVYGDEIELLVDRQGRVMPSTAGR